MKISIDTEPQYKLSPYLFMQFAEPLGIADSSIDAAWDFKKNCWQPGVIAILRELAPTMIRWGGCFASYYHWKEGVGPKRIPMHNICWDGIYLNQVGTAELAQLAGETGSELLLNVNFLSEGQKKWFEPVPGDNRIGTAEEAAEWIRYCNDPDDKLRRSHGVENPYNIRYWQIGNETGYMPPSFSEPGFSARENAVHAAEFVKAMRQADPSIRIIVWGDGPNQVWQERFRNGERSDWTQEVCESVGDGAELVAFHNHFGGEKEYAPIAGTGYRKDPALTWDLLRRAAQDFRDRLEYMTRSVKPYGKKLAMTEGHLVHTCRDRTGLMASWAVGVMYAECFNTLQRYGDTVEIATLADFMGNRWNSNAVILPAPAWIPGARPYLLPVGHIAKLYRHHIGTDAVNVQTTASAVDAVASRTGNKFFCHLVNKDRSTPQKIELNIGGNPIRSCKIREISADPELEMMENTRNALNPREYTISDGNYLLPAAAVAVVEAELPILP